MDPSRKRLFIAGAAIFVLVAIFLAGYLPERSRARAASGETERLTERLREREATLAQKQFDLQVARPRGHLGETLHEANANNFSVAAERATTFFDAARRAASRSGGATSRNCGSAVGIRRYDAAFGDVKAGVPLPHSSRELRERRFQEV